MEVIFCAYSNMVEKGSKHERGIKWDPEIDCKPGRPENQQTIVTPIVGPKEIPEPESSPITTRRVRKKGSPSPKTIIEKGGKEYGAQG
jgi:hypothetical protein